MADSQDTRSSVEMLDDDFADQMRLAAVRRWCERGGLDVGGPVLPWAQLMESERNRWRDLAHAAHEAMTR